MSVMLKRWLSAYAILLTCLALIGAQNRQLFDVQDSLVDQKQALQVERANLRVRAESVRSNDVIAAFAEAKGMIPAPRLEQAVSIFPLPAPNHQASLETGLEVYMLWR